MRDLDAVKREIRDRVPLVEIVSQHVALRQRGQRFLGLCPFHQEKTPSFTVHADRGFFKCFGCGRGGDVFTFVQLIENTSFGEAMRILADRAGIELRRSGGKTPEGPGRADLARINEWACGYFRRQLQSSPAADHARRYVRQRGVTPETETAFEFGFAAGNLETLLEQARRAGLSTADLIAADLAREGERGVYPTFRDRLMFPIRDSMNRVIGFGGRTLCDDKAKYLNTRQTALFEKGQGFYGLAQARQRMTETDRVVVTEGYFDAVMAHQAGFAETVATLGTALGAAQVELLRRYVSTAVFLFDSDAAGEAAAERAIEIALPLRLTVKMAKVTAGKDPADYLLSHPPQDFEGILNSAVDALEFKWLQLLQRFDRDDLKSRHQAVSDFLELIQRSFQTQAVDAITRGLVANRVGALLSLDPREVLAAVGRVRSGRAEPSVAGARRTERARVRDPLEACAVQALEVVLNEPGLVGGCATVLEQTEYSEEVDRVVARVVLDLFESYGEFELGEVLSRCEDPAVARRVTELAEHGMRRGNYEETVAVAVSRWTDLRREREVAGLRQRVTLREAAVVQADEVNQAYCEGVRSGRHFRPLRRSGAAGLGARSAERDAGSRGGDQAVQGADSSV